MTAPSAVAVLLASVAVLAGCTGDAEPDGASGPSPTPPPAERVDLSGLPVARESFCEALHADGVEQVLGGPVLATSHYGNGEEAEITPGYVDVSHEYSCTFTGTPPTAARAWVFARPVQAAEARRLVRAVEAERDCRFPESLQFGTPSVTSACEEEGPEPVVRTTMRGLFADAWLSCELTVPREGTTRQKREELLTRTEQWCVDVVTTIGARL